MRLEMIVVPLESSSTRPVIPVITLQLPAGAMIRLVGYHTKEHLVLAHGKAKYEYLPIAFVELDPDDTTLIARHYVLVPTGGKMAPHAGKTARWIASGMSHDGVMAAHLFEIVEAA